MKFGLVELIQSGLRFFASNGSNHVGLKPPASAPASSFDLTLFNSLPAGTEAVTVTNTGQLGTTAISGGHTQNTDTGTTSDTFALDSDATGVLLKNSSGELQLRNLGDSSYANIRVANLVVEGTTTTVNSETVSIADNVFVLNSDVTGTPSEDGGLEVERGTETNAQILWQESSDQFAAGLAGALRRIALSVGQSFVDADLTAGVLTFAHNLGQQYPAIVVVNNSGKQVIPDDVTFTNANSAAIDLTSYGTLTGTWNVRAVG
jgi:hypothetical protein